jgi:hypothetical protein
MSSSEREELELAAKAAGLVVAGWNDGEEPYSSGPGLILNDGRLWNPRRDSGQSFALSVNLSFCQTQWFNHDPPDVMIGYKTSDGEGRNWIEDHNGDPVAATRRAITRAAAEIGRAMP